VRRIDLTRHLKRHIYKDKIFRCKECEYSGEKKWHLTRHIRDNHAATEIHATTEIILEINKKSEIIKQSEETEVCEENEKIDNEKILTVHEKIRRFKCDKCAYQSSSKYGLSKHIKTYHEKYFEFKCEQCTYVTVRRSDLTRHLKRHKTEVFEENEKIDNEKILLKSSQNYQDNCAEAKCCDVEYKHICRCCSHHAEEEGKFTLKDLKKHLKKEHILTYNDYVNYILVHF
jgi:hypothetical protein